MSVFGQAGLGPLRVSNNHPNGSRLPDGSMCVSEISNGEVLYAQGRIT